AAATVCLFEWARRRMGKGAVLEALIAAAAHDIRSPLTAMKGFGYALEKRWDQLDDDQRALMLRGIVHDADRMDQILRLLVDAATTIASERVDGDLHIWAQRAGATIDRADAEALFTPRKPGTGAGSKIGLYVARAVAEAQGGQAWADVDGDTLSFHVRVPLPR